MRVKRLLQWLGHIDLCLQKVDKERAKEQRAAEKRHADVEAARLAAVGASSILPRTLALTLALALDAEPDLRT